MNFKLVLFSFVILNVYHFLDAQQLDFKNDCNCHLPPVNRRLKAGDVSYSVPWQVSLTTKPNGEHTCGGVIINKKWIVTSAQCVQDIDSDDKLQFVKVRTGVYTLNNLNKYPNSYDVAQIIVDKRFNKNAIKKEGDIAFLEIEGLLQFNSDVGPACFPSNQTQFQSYHEENILRTFGYRTYTKDIRQTSISNLGSYYQRLKESYLKNDGCRLDEYHLICAINAAYNRDEICGGDLGMPLSEDKDGKTRVIGFATFSFVRRLRWGETSWCDGKHAFARLSYYMEDFDKVVPNNYCTRTVCALLEVYQTDEGIKVPDVLKPYLPNKYKEIIPFTKLDNVIDNTGKKGTIIIGLLLEDRIIIKSDSQSIDVNEGYFNHYVLNQKIFQLDQFLDKSEINLTKNKIIFAISNFSEIGKTVIRNLSREIIKTKIVENKRIEKLISELGKIKGNSYSIIIIGGKFEYGGETEKLNLVKVENGKITNCTVNEFLAIGIGEKIVNRLLKKTKLNSNNYNKELDRVLNYIFELKDKIVLKDDEKLCFKSFKNDDTKKYLMCGGNIQQIELIYCAENVNVIEEMPQFDKKNTLLENCYINQQFLNVKKNRFYFFIKLFQKILIISVVPSLCSGFF